MVEEVEECVEVEIEDMEHGLPIGVPTGHWLPHMMLACAQNKVARVLGVDAGTSLVRTRIRRGCNIPELRIRRAAGLVAGIGTWIVGGRSSRVPG